MDWKNKYNYTLLDIEGEIKESNKPVNERFTKKMFGEEKWIPLDKLKVDIEVQRELQDSHVQNIIKKFDPSAFGRLVVTQREDGYYYITDGQHRKKTLELLGINEAPCVVVNLCNLKDEGMNFININQQSAKVSNIDKYRIGCSSMITEWLRVKEVVDFVSCTVGTSKGQISCTSALYKLVNTSKLETSRARDIELAKKSLLVLKSVWGIESITHAMVNGMFIFLKNHTFINDDTNTKDVITRLSSRKIPWKEINNKAHTMKENNNGSGKVYSYIAYQFYVEYNNGMKKNRLPLRIEI